MDQANSAFLKYLPSSLQPPGQSTLSSSPPKFWCGEHLVKTPSLKNFTTRSNSPSVVSEDTSKIQGDMEPSPIVLGEQATMEKTTQRFQRNANTLAELNAEGLSAQSVNDLFSMCVGAASQHVLRMSLVPDQGSQDSLDTGVTAFWSQLIQRDAASPLFFLPRKLGGLGVGPAVQRYAAASGRAWQSVIPTLVAVTQSPETDNFFISAPWLHAQLVQYANHALTTHEQARLHPQATGFSPRPKQLPQAAS